MGVMIRVGNGSLIGIHVEPGAGVLFAPVDYGCGRYGQHDYGEDGPFNAEHGVVGDASRYFANGAEDGVSGGVTAVR